MGLLSAPWWYDAIGCARILFQLVQVNPRGHSNQHTCHTSNGLQTLHEFQVTCCSRREARAFRGLVVVPIFVTPGSQTQLPVRVRRKILKCVGPNKSVCRCTSICLGICSWCAAQMKRYDGHANHKVHVSYLCLFDVVV